MAIAFKDYYQILGVPKTATEDEIRKEYRSLARKHHPDLNPGNKAAEDKFKEINEAYEVLSDSAKRLKYDQLGSNSQAGEDFRPPPGWTNGRAGFHNGNAGFGPENGGEEFGDFFETLFGGRRAARGGATFRMPGEDVNATISLTLEEAHSGVMRTIKLEGAGAKVKSLEVTIPPGVRDGSVIRLAGQGDPGTDGAPAGDLFLHVNMEAHHLFQLLGDDVQVELPVTPWEAVLGAKVNVPTLDHPVEMSVPAGSQAGQRLRLRGQGLKKRAGGRGDEYVKLKIVVPSSPTAREKELFENLAAESRFNPREPLAGRD
jgi:DnaJ-class molecular chaperone